MGWVFCVLLHWNSRRVFWHDLAGVLVGTCFWFVVVGVSCALTLSAIGESVTGLAKTGFRRLKLSAGICAVNRKFSASMLTGRLRCG